MDYWLPGTERLGEIVKIMKELLELMAMLCVLTDVKVSWVYSFASS